MEKLYCILWKMAIINEKKNSKAFSKVYFFILFLFGPGKIPGFSVEKREKPVYIPESRMKEV